MTAASWLFIERVNCNAWGGFNELFYMRCVVNVNRVPRERARVRAQLFQLVITCPLYLSCQRKLASMLLSFTELFMDAS